MKKLFFLGLVASFFFGMHSVQASDITNVSALYTTDNKVFLQWDHLADSLLYDTDGYAIQYSEYENKVRNVDPGKLFLNKKLNNLSLRAAAFEDNTWYYFRIYTYVVDGRSRILTNGSKVLKWKYLSNGETESEIIEPNDPVVADNSSSVGIEFGKLRVTRYDTYATFSWSRPNLAKSDATGVIVVLKKYGSADTLVELKAGLDITSGKITGLTPETKYEAKGYFYKYVGGENKKFGTGINEIFTTQKAYSAVQKARIERLRKRGLVRDSALTTVSVPGSSTTTTTTDTSTEDTTSTTTTTSSSTSDSNIKTRAQIQKKIAELERELQSWKLKLRRLGTSSNSSSNRTTSTQPRYPDYGSSSTRTTTATKSRETLRERMCRVLKRNCK
jgi:hypothetical protein